MRKALLIDLFALPEYDISLALGYLKAYADADPAVKAAWRIELMHFPVDTPPGDIVAAIDRVGPALVGFSCYSWNIRSVEKVLAKLPNLDDRLVALGGIEVTPDPAGYMKANPVVDLVVFGEGEVTFRELLDRLKEGVDRFGPATMEGLQGVCWRDGRHVRRNTARPPIADLETVPSPYLTGAYGDLLEGQDRVMVETTRGCPYTCTFCFEPRGFARVRSFPVERAKAEVEAIIEAGVKEVVFLDTNFNMDRPRAIELWDFLARRGRGVRYAFELRGELLDENQSRSLSQLDYFAEIGLQSIHKKSLDAVKRWYEPDRFAAGVSGLLEAGIYRPCAHSGHGGVSVDLMMGLPHETVEHLLASFDFVFALCPSTLVLTMTKILPGTELWDDAKKFRYEFDTGAQYEMTGSSTVTRKDIGEMVRFRDAVEFAYNRLHAVRTIGWLAGELGVRPSAIFVEIGRRMATPGRAPATFTVDDLERFLAEIAADRGRADLGKAVADKLGSEDLLNRLQRNREARRTWWADFVFRVGYRLLTRFGGLPPLPKPEPAKVLHDAPEGAAAVA
jgi:radical SAM superfamily enzyme YgiQ (UPF0313 family)